MKNEKQNSVATSQFSGLLADVSARAYCSLHQDGPLTWKAVQVDLSVPVEYRGCRWHVDGKPVAPRGDMSLASNVGETLRIALRQRRVELVAQAIQCEAKTPTWNQGTTWYITCHKDEEAVLQIDFEHATCRLGRSRKYIHNLSVDNLAKLARQRMRRMLSEAQERQQDREEQTQVATKKQGLILQLREAGIRSDAARTIHVQEWSAKEGFVLSYLRKDRTLKASFNVKDALAAARKIQALDQV
jgi:hypothetical protein